MNSPLHALTQIETAASPWWKGASIYQIYPRSFADSNGDGIGDLCGITARLDYVAKLGVDAIWLSPFYPSPMADFGYDISDYENVDPVFGTLADFDALVTRAHDLGLRVIIDQVYAHSSDAHSWFTQSRQDQTGAKADWYVWADPKADGSPPNNWQAVFGGPSWTWDARRGQYYHHNFLSSQPQLNVANPEVQEALLATSRFWLDRRVDGFRIDAINFAMHNPDFADNPPAPATGKRRTRPFDFQLHIHNQSQPGISVFLEKVRNLLDEYGATFSVAEVGGDTADAEMKDFTRGDNRLNTAYSFDFLYADTLTPAKVADAVSRWPDTPDTGWPSWAFENHDAPRAISRWTTPGNREAFARMKMLLLVCLRGNIFLYNGEELGLTQVDIAQDQLQDPEAIANWPLTLSRDGARTPMPWDSQAEHLGFSAARPWLPAGPDHPAMAVDRQEKDSGSLLQLTRHLLTLRNRQPALRLGAMDSVEAGDTVLIFARTHKKERLLCGFNFGHTSAPADMSGDPVAAVNGATPALLPPMGGLVLRPRT